MKSFKKVLSASVLGLVGAMFSPVVGIAIFGLSLLFGGGNASGFAFTGIFDPSGLTLPTEGIKAISELIYSSKFASPAWKQFMGVVPGIKNNKQIVVIGHYNGLAGAVKSACDITPNPDKIGAVEKTWNPMYVSDRFEECYDNLQGTFWQYMLANGLKKEDLTQSDYEGFVTKLLMEYMSDDMIYRLIFFTDTSIVAGVGNNLGAGQLKYFNMLDGVFKQCETIVTATPAQRVTITENAGVNYAAQAFATASPTVHPATDYLNLLVYGATMELRGVSDPVILATQSFVDQYAQERKAVTNIELAYTRIEGGIKSFEFNGIPVIPIFTWDRLIHRHFDDGTKWLNPHRALYTSKSNILVGTEEIANLGELSAEYNTYHKKFFSDFGFNFDVKVIEDAKIQYAY